MTKHNSYEKTIKRFLILLSLLIISPVVLSIAFKALRKYKDAPENIIAYALLCLGVCLIIYTIYFGFITFKILLDVIFKK